MATNTKNKIERFCYKWLPIVFGCHCRPDRSFFYKGKQFPICARCTGVLFGMIASLIVSIMWIMPLRLCLLLILPLVIDGAMQKATRYESNNVLRFVTGVLFGYAMASLIITFLASGYRRGYEWGMKRLP